MKINVIAKPYYQGTKTLDGVDYTLTFRWNVTTSAWYMDLESSAISIKGVALLTGVNLLARYGYRQLGELWVIDNAGEDANPTFDDFGSRFTLEYYPVT